MSSQPFNTFQQIFALSWASNLARTCTGSAFEIQEQLSQFLDDQYLETNVGPGWHMAWGPAAWQYRPKKKPARPNNVWFVAKNDRCDTDGMDPAPVYVVCIAGTAGKLLDFDSEVEDLAVGRVVDLNQWIPDSFAGDIIPEPTATANPDFAGTIPYVSYGTAIGTHVITSMSLATPDGQPSTHPCLSTFLKNVSAEPGARIIFTGHSLGSALCSSAAFVLAKANILDKFSKVLVYPTAGASPGERNFVTEFSQRFPPILPSEEQPIYMTWNQNTINSLDIVPHAWCTLDTYPQNLNVIPTMYGNSLQDGVRIYWFLEFLRGRLVQRAKHAWPKEPKQNVYIPLPSSIFSSEKQPVPQTKPQLEKLLPSGPCQKVTSEGYPPMGESLIMACAEDAPIEQIDEENI
ncbi:hypothetical protein B0J17DRAFT_721353 [Rhizoctonia solani]|nr:hypothetical protein B0J17DRAFT_721353 [Rhizoctonia solani]